MEKLMPTFNRKSLTCIVLFLLIGVSNDAIAQSKSPVASDTAFIEAFMAELRQLRIAVELLTKTQTQSQALSVYLSVQQSRITQAAARLDSAIKESDTLTASSEKVAAQVTGLETALIRATAPTERSLLESRLDELKKKQREIGVQEEQASARRRELLQILQMEESRWNDLTSQLLRLLKQ
jgi:hypothetical protein